MLANKLGILEILLEIIDAETEMEVIHASILAANALTHQYPDVFDGRCVKAIKAVHGTQTEEKIVCDSLRWLQKACILHETNRQLIMNEGVLANNLLPLLKNENPQIIRELSACLRFLVLDGKQIERNSINHSRMQETREIFSYLDPRFKTFLAMRASYLTEIVKNGRQNHQKSSLSRILTRKFKFWILFPLDDVRVEFGKAHEHAREIATEALPALTELLKSK